MVMTEFYAGLDVSDKTTHICAVDKEGKVAWRGVCTTDPKVLASTLQAHCPGLMRVVLETGTLSSFLYHGLMERGLPVVCICARHAKGVLSVQVNKSDVHDAEGLAQMARTGWYKAVHMKDSQTHLDRARLKMREQMVRAHNTLVNQMRFFSSCSACGLAVRRLPACATGVWRPYFGKDRSCATSLPPSWRA
jgi:transposase